MGAVTPRSQVYVALKIPESAWDDVAVHSMRASIAKSNDRMKKRYQETKKGHGDLRP